MGYLFLNACIASTMTKNIDNPLKGRFLEFFSGTKEVMLYSVLLNEDAEIFLKTHLEVKFKP